MTPREKTEAINLYGDWKIESLQWALAQAATHPTAKRYIQFVLSIRHRR
jgi:hypothetical protein